MKRKLIAAAVLTLVAGAALAAKPTSIVYVNDVPAAGGESYSLFKVKCSDGTDKNVSAWDNRKLWCQGEGLKDDCDKKQIGAAKKACR